MKRPRNYSLIAIIAFLLTAASVASAEESAVVRRAAHLRLRWELIRNTYDAKTPEGKAQAALTLTNFDDISLPATGWAIYFNCMDSMETGRLEGDLALERVGGGLFRLRPLTGFKGLAPAQTLRVNYGYPQAIVKLAVAPAGPYLVLDDDRETGALITDYQIDMPTRPEQLDKGPSDHAPIISAEDVYLQNESIVDIRPQALPPIFPTPQLFRKGSGSLRLTAMPRILASGKLKDEADFAGSLLQRFLPASQTGVKSSANAAVRLAIGKVAGRASPEAYELTIDGATGIAIKGNTAAGVSRGLQSLRDLLPLMPTAELDLPELYVNDAPRFAYRGFQLDVARNFQSKQAVFKLLDLTARYKLNTLHFHLTDDEGWRLEIAGLPELTSVGGRRGQTMAPTEHLQPAYGSGPDLADPHGSGFYSRADYIEILKYAGARHIDVIPEIEMPGHARAAVFAMKSRFEQHQKAADRDAGRYLLSDSGDKSKYESPQQYGDNVIDPGLPSTYAFIDHVVGDVVSMYREAGAPLRTIHVGGDELAEGAWERSPASRALMRRKKLATTGQLWDYFYDRVDQILAKHHLFVTGWAELGARKRTVHGETKLVPNPRFSHRGFNVIVWNNTDGYEDFGCRLANAGYATILAPVTNLYFDMAYNKNPEEPGVDWGGFVDLKTVFDFAPFDCNKKGDREMSRNGGTVALTAQGRRNIKGLEATLFTETVRNPSRIDYMIMPRLTAMAERAWAGTPGGVAESDDAGWSRFVNTLGKRVLPRLDLEPANVQYRIAPPGLMVVDGRVMVNHEIPGLTLRYTSDGTEPNASSALVTGPIAQKGMIAVAAFDRLGRHGEVAHVENP